MNARNRGYTPDLPPSAWAAVDKFVHKVVAEVGPTLPYPQASILNAVAHHVDWCCNIAGLPLKRKALFRRDVIGAAVGFMPTASTSTMGRRRSILFRVGEALEVIPVPPPLPRLAASAATAPYSTSQVEELSTWAHLQRDTSMQTSARALLALGLGAGLPTRQLFETRARDVISGGASVMVSGPNPRRVVVLDEWADELAELSAGLEPDEPLFRPRTSWHKNVVTIFLARSIGDGLRPSTQRMRTTWLVRHLTDGTPMHELLYAAGIKKMDALNRYQEFLPAPELLGFPDTTERPRR